MFNSSTESKVETAFIILDLTLGLKKVEVYPTGDRKVADQSCGRGGRVENVLHSCPPVSRTKMLGVGVGISFRGDC